MATQSRSGGLKVEQDQPEQAGNTPQAGIDVLKSFEENSLCIAVLGSRLCNDLYCNMTQKLRIIYCACT